MKLLLTLFFLSPLWLKAEDLPLYKATNGVTYHVGDTLKLGRGSADDGTFHYINAGGIVAWQFIDPRRNRKQLNAPRTYASNNAIIKKIKVSHGGPDANRVTFVVDLQAPTNFNVYIEDAIGTCEVVPCSKTAALTSESDKLDQIKKLKALLDSGAITKEEYEAEKKKLLN
ncbi:SHOCT domain-containing protein [Mucilaginibacter ginkgonis]|uniref:SHOCT domain-containing protein n=1 Tax=Mucilaginibacter ginkgonis TaxID=2682091 RepID=A0A6I4HVV2_9SPHI|nr:SHOCT domain-containing protein [Mucilaginibacter ginkgonis]QQL51073.1 SHOCT domain-containing protein [Mucilaginibacter ginkgonis]